MYILLFLKIFFMHLLYSREGRLTRAVLLSSRIADPVCYTVST